MKYISKSRQKAFYFSLIFHVFSLLESWSTVFKVFHIFLKQKKNLKEWFRCVPGYCLKKPVYVLLQDEKSKYHKYTTHRKHSLTLTPLFLVEIIQVNPRQTFMCVTLYNILSQKSEVQIGRCFIKKRVRGIVFKKFDAFFNMSKKKVNLMLIKEVLFMSFWQQVDTEGLNSHLSPPTTNENFHTK